MSGVIRPSNLIEKENYALIVICNRDGSKKTESIIDLDDIQVVKNYRWHTTTKNYVRSFIDGKYVYLHRLILNLKNDNILVDHINKNPLDNRKNNLRLADLSLNRINSKTNINNTSGFRGVLFRKKTKKWEANIRVNGKKLYLAETKNKDEAIRKRLSAEEKYYINHEVNI